MLKKAKFMYTAIYFQLGNLENGRIELRENFCNSNNGLHASSSNWCQFLVCLGPLSRLHFTLLELSPCATEFKCLTPTSSPILRFFNCLFLCVCLEPYTWFLFPSVSETDQLGFCSLFQNLFLLLN